VTFTRRETLVLAAAASAASLAGLTPAWAKEGDTFDVAKLMAPAGGYVDHVLGDDKATITVIEYASPTCPHCARFSQDVLPKFIALYVDSGKVKFILRPFVRNVLDAVVFLVAEAAGPANFQNVIDTYFKTQATWEVSDKPRDALLAIAEQLGFTEESFDAALTNQDLFTGMDKVRDQALNDFQLEGTPTFYINGKQLTGEKTLADLAAEIEPLLPADQKTPADQLPTDQPAADAPADTSTPVAP
jgi:predicted DsbA family dithiol-disulfide isomerase